MARKVTTRLSFDFGEPTQLTQMSENVRRLDNATLEVVNRKLPAQAILRADNDGTVWNVEFDPRIGWIWL